jgi:formylglycine-generating enzyme required for sulfatase activity
VDKIIVAAILILSVVPACAGGVVVTAVSGSAPGSVIEIGAGKTDGVREGMTVSILEKGGAGGRAVGVRIAQAKVIAVFERTSRAALTEVGPDRRVQKGCPVGDFLPPLHTAAAPGAAPSGAGQGTAAKGGEADPAGETWTNPKDGLVYVYIPPGTFQMGCVPGDAECAEIERPTHAVRITEGFWLGRTEVTVGAYKRFCAAAGKGMPAAPLFNPDWQFEDHPIVGVSWEDARNYCAWVGGRLPTEAEREYAARGGKEGAIYPSGNTISHEDANFGQEFCCGPLSQGKDRWENTAPVGSFEPNGFGLFDMAGNVWEWCADWWWGAYYIESPPADPPGPPSGTARIGRGGGWTSHAWLCRTSQRSGFEPNKKDTALGFRAICVPEKPERGEKSGAAK